METLCGTRDAANAWDEFFNNSVIEDEYEIVLASPCSYYHRAQDSHGWFERVVISKRRSTCWWRASDDKRVTILNRLIDLQGSGGDRAVTLEPDPRHMDSMKDACGLSVKSRAVTTHGDKKLDNYGETLLSASQATSFRSSAMRLAFVAADIPVFAFVANRLARHLAKPAVGAWTD